MGQVLVLDFVMLPYGLTFVVATAFLIAWRKAVARKKAQAREEAQGRKAAPEFRWDPRRCGGADAVD